MNLNNTTLEYKHYEDFQKYARFICEKFDVSVQLESNLAETDGKVIYLPNISSLTPKELDLMYAVLLHETGHIRYSTFSQEYFSALKTSAHAFLANCIEDARVENLLCKDFAGAKEIFESFYCDYIQDKTLIKKIFKHDGKYPDLFTTLGFYLHNQLSEFDTPPLNKISTSPKAKKIQKFIQDNDLDKYLSNHSLKNDTDVISLTNYIYDLFVKYFNIKDKSKKTNIVSTIKFVDDAGKKLADLKDFSIKSLETVNKLEKEMEEILSQINKYEQEHKDEYESLSDSIGELQEDISSNNNKIEKKKTFDSISNDIKELNSKIESSSNKDFDSDIAKNKNLKDELDKKLSGGTTARGKEFTPEQLDAIKNKIEVRQRKIDSLEKSKEKNASSIEEMKKSLDSNKENLKNFENFSDIDISKLSEKNSESSKKINNFEKSISELDEGKQHLEDSFIKLQNKVSSIEGSIMNKVAEELFSLEENSEIPLNLLPELNDHESWPESAQLQNDFDKKATQETGKITRNGQMASGTFGSNLSEIIGFLDKKETHVKQLDLAEFLKKDFAKNKFQDFNIDAETQNKEITHIEDTTILGDFENSREFVPSTTMFDTIIKENSSKKATELLDLNIQNKEFFSSLKNIFAKKFKFNKKEFWKGAQEEGQFDTRNLWKLPTNQGSDYYEISNPKFNNKVAASIVIDISGSQNKEITDYGNHIRTLVLGLSQALDAVHIKHEILGYHAPLSPEMKAMDSAPYFSRKSNRLETIIFKEANQKDKSGIMNIEPKMSDNSDGESLRIAIKRLKAIKAKSHMIFLISDGKPFLCDSDLFILDNDFKKTIDLAQKNKIKIFGLGFFDDLKKFLDTSFCNSSNKYELLKYFDKSPLFS